jgi:hypothetical protein
MKKVLNPFDRLDPLLYLRFKQLVERIDDKQTLLEIGRLLEVALKKL